MWTQNHWLATTKRALNKAITLGASETSNKPVFDLFSDGKVFAWVKLLLNLFIVCPEIEGIS